MHHLSITWANLLTGKTRQLLLEVGDQRCLELTPVRCFLLAHPSLVWVEINRPLKRNKAAQSLTVKSLWDLRAPLVSELYLWTLPQWIKVHQRSSKTSPLVTWHLIYLSMLVETSLVTIISSRKICEPNWKIKATSWFSPQLTKPILSPRKVIVVTPPF